MSANIRYTPSETHVFGLYEPEGDGITFYATEKERDEAAKKAIKAYVDDNEWCDEVTGVFGFVVTHQAAAINVAYPAGPLDEEGYDEDGEYWPDNCGRKCDYALTPIPQPPQGGEEQV